MQPISRNKRAFSDYEILDKLEAGIVLTGPEVKSAKTGGASLVGSYAKVLGGELYLVGAQIQPYRYATSNESYDPQRSRKLLVHAQELRRLQSALLERGRTLVPLELHVSRGRVKILIGVGRAKKKFDKRETIKQRETTRKLQRVVKRSIKNT
ncbi:MAG: SsrA-binding protein [Candidatus Doudnabacteria bacterium RIFCSPHIGHO2_01_FULL_50_11]|uniref:SsrA-binding protein n=1 Tax=Candidatus Doudnabacteria bacterium RIFCSPHIGHO2_01_FULL_50_11 TaxID=1817828 RepID=A0A1F5PMM4_9BACT|nr:MAG: SsrA-binding protein [Candidatus Doudnabacteria bacterium RIFCSPHIGHO2_01_FULL_50_11]